MYVPIFACFFFFGFFFIPVALYTLLGFIQMTIWAKGKHRAYSREFKDYPSLRMAIIPLILWEWKHGPLCCMRVHFHPHKTRTFAAPESSIMQVFYINEWTERSGNESNNIMAIHWSLLKTAWNIWIVCNEVNLYCCHILWAVLTHSYRIVLLFGLFRTWQKVEKWHFGILATPTQGGE